MGKTRVSQAGSTPRQRQGTMLTRKEKRHVSRTLGLAAMMAFPPLDRSLRKKTSNSDRTTKQMTNAVLNKVILHDISYKGPDHGDDRAAEAASIRATEPGWFGASVVLDRARHQPALWLLPGQVADRKHPPDHQQSCVSQHATVTGLSFWESLVTDLARFPVLPKILGRNGQSSAPCALFRVPNALPTRPTALVGHSAGRAHTTGASAEEETRKPRARPIAQAS
ncbi:hypothetical protein NDU88_007674 [Pleurodeles waltl]|uniref:Uncharacterized protein n=1 Tax=Pleurodeles waltl TaxID=8319 RepID=A0AAV7STL6_PLEWA|nr:hypothetical protein NDU88_007674 [Pleurodeles waltl]